MIKNIYQSIFYCLLLCGALSCNKENITPNKTSVIVNNEISIEEIKFISPTIGYLVGGVKRNYGVVYKTIDGGTSWALLKTVPERLNSLYLFDEDNGFFVGDKRENDTLNILKLTNNIITDISYYDQWSSSDFQDIQFIDSDRGFIASEDNLGLGYIFRTVDAGKTWKYERDLYNGQLDITINKEEKIITGTFGTIKEVSSNGITITPLDLESDIFYDVDFVSNNILYTCGYNGNIYKSSNKGDSWEIVFKKSVFNTKHFLNICFINEKIGFACGEKGVLLQTTDSGKTWQSIDISTKSDLNTLDAINNTLFIGTSQGEVISIDLNSL